MNDLEVKEQKNYGRGIGKVRGKDKREEKPSSGRRCVQLGDSRGAALVIRKVFGRQVVHEDIADNFIHVPWLLLGVLSKKYTGLNFLPNIFTICVPLWSAPYPVESGSLPVQNAGFRSYSLIEWLDKLLNLPCLRFLIYEMRMMIW